MRKWMLSVAALLMALLMTGNVLADVVVAPGGAADAGFRGWESQKRYQYIQFGNYPQTKKGDVEPVLWRVLDVYADGTAFLLAEYVLDAHQVIEENDPKVKENHTYRKIAAIEESDLYPWMNDVMANTMFTAEEQSVLDTSRGVVFMPTDDEYLTGSYGFSAARYAEVKQRQCNCTDYARAQGVYREGNASTYWCNAVKNPADHKLQLVGVNGHLSYGGYTRSNVGIRPAILVRPGSVMFASGSGTKDDPYVLSLTGNAE